MSITLDRNLSTNTNTALKGSSLIVVPLLYIDFPDPAFARYYAGSTSNINIRDSAVMPSGIYLGVGGIASISTTEESVDLKASKLIAQLNGIDSTYVSLVLGIQYYGSEARFGVVVLDSEYSVVGNPILLYKGFVATMTTNIDSKASISVEIESILADWERPRVKRYNNRDQKFINNSDKGFNNVAEIVAKEVVWGG